jgi:sigma-B regulation protein RsbU (phosphoserine phosphatase)
MFDFYFRAERLREKYNSLSGEAREISVELGQARKLHEALFPEEVTGGPIEVAYRYEPMREIGGDFLYVHRETGGAVSIVLIDVSGHGIAAALAVNRLHGEMQRFFSHYPVASGESGRPGHLLMNLNTYACAALAPQGVYATALVVRFEPAGSTGVLSPTTATAAAGCGSSGRLEWASAGHPTAYVRGGTGQVYDLPSTAVMLGVIDADVYDAGARQLGFQPGDCLLAYTDGAMEARDAAGKDFSAARIRSVLQFAAIASAAERPMAAGGVVKALAEQVAKHRRGRVEDDTLIVEVVASPMIGSPAKMMGETVPVG